MKKYVVSACLWLLAFSWLGTGHGQLPMSHGGLGAPSGGGGGGNTVVFDASCVGAVSGQTVTTSGAITCLTIQNTNPNVFVVIQLISMNTGNMASPTCTWNGISTTAITSTTRLFSFGLVNPTTGAHPASCSWTNNDQSLLALSSWYTVNQTTPTNSSTSNSGTGTTASVAPTGQSGNKCLGAYNTTSNFATASGTDIGHSNAGNTFSGAANWDAQGNTLSYTFSPSAAWTAMGFCVAGT